MKHYWEKCRDFPPSKSSIIYSMVVLVMLSDFSVVTTARQISWGPSADIIFQENETSSPRSRTGEKIIPCGMTKELKANEWAFIESPINSTQQTTQQTSCKWRFLFSGCRLAVSCPTFRSKDLSCSDYLEISSSDGLKKQYCGSKGPKSLVTTNETEITYRTNNLFNSLGFRCRVACNTPNEGSDSEADALPIQVAAPVNCSCGLTAPPTKIINGVEAEINEFPWMAGLVRKGGSTPFCGASLINSRYILTAAHCVSGRTPSNLDIILNEHNTQSGDETKFPVIRRSVEAIYPHKSYSSRLDYDAAIIKLRDDVQHDMENGILLPVCLPSLADRKKTYENNPVIVSGWGVEMEGGFVSPVLRKTGVTVLTNRACVSSYPGSITTRMLCAAAPSKDACQGDSGGPLVHESSGRFTQIGIVSWGHGCARPNKPGVYSRVTEFLRWIAQTTADGRFCNE